MNLSVFAQKKIDPIKEKSYEELMDIIYNDLDTVVQRNYARAWISKGKKEGDYKKVVIGYYISSSLYNDNTKLHYCDSVILLTSKKSFDLYPGVAYLSRGSYFHEKGDYKNAINNYVLANKFATKNKKSNLIVASNFGIGAIKRKIGQYNEALKLYRENRTISKKLLLENSNGNNYLNSLMAMSNIFYELEHIDSASYYNKLGVVESIRLNNEYSLHHFSINEGIVNFLKGNNDIAIDSIKKHNIFFEKTNDTKNLLYSYYYLGKSYLSKQDQLMAINYFEKVDSIFDVEKDVPSKIRESFENLMDYHEQKGNLEKQLFYANRLMLFDSIIRNNNFYLNTKILKDYDFPKLVSKKDLLLTEMKARESLLKNTIVSISVIISILIFVLYKQFKKRKLYKKRFEEIINSSGSFTNGEEKISPKNINIPQELLEDILSQLNRFEEKNEFTSNKITLNYLAKRMKTNSNYLSKIINHYKNDSFSNYINNLRIEYIIKLLKTDSVYRKYTFKAIAEDIGFNNSESFSKAFYRSKGIKPSYFMKELERHN